MTPPSPTRPRNVGYRVPTGDRVAAGSRPPMPGRPLSRRQPPWRPDVRTSPATGGDDDRHAARQWWAGRGCLVPLLLLLVPSAGLVAVAVAVAGDDEDVASSPGFAASTPAAFPTTAPAGPAATSLPPITLPGPLGTAPRVRPLQTVILVSPEVLADAETVTSLGDELAASVAYFDEHAIPGDGAGLGPAPELVRFPMAALTEQAPLGGPAEAAADGPGAVTSTLASLAASHPADDRTVVVLTTNPARWLPVLPVAPPSDLRIPPAGRPAAARGFVVDVRRGTGAEPSLGLPPVSSPLTTAADPTVRGAVAAAIAQSWVASFDGTWAALP